MLVSYVINSHAIHRSTVHSLMFKASRLFTFKTQLRRYAMNRNRANRYVLRDRIGAIDGGDGNNSVEQVNKNESAESTQRVSSADLTPNNQAVANGGSRDGSSSLDNGPRSNATNADAWNVGSRATSPSFAGDNGSLGAGGAATRSDLGSAVQEIIQGLQKILPIIQELMSMLKGKGSDESATSTSERDAASSSGPNSCGAKQSVPEASASGESGGECGGGRGGQGDAGTSAGTKPTADQRSSNQLGGNVSSGDSGDSSGGASGVSPASGVAGGSAPQTRVSGGPTDGKTMTDLLASPGSGFNIWMRKPNAIEEGNKALDEMGRSNSMVRVVMESGAAGAREEMRNALNGFPGTKQLILSPFTGQNNSDGTWAGEQWTGKNPNGSAQHLALMKEMGEEGAAQMANGRKDFAIQLWNEAGGDYKSIEDSAVEAMKTLASTGYKGNVVIPSSPGYSQDGFNDPSKVVDLYNNIATRVANETGEPRADVANRMAMSFSMYDGALGKSSQEIANVFSTLKSAGVNAFGAEIGAGGNSSDGSGSMDPSQGLSPDNALQGAVASGATILGWSLNHDDGHQIQNGSGNLTEFGRKLFEFSRRQAGASS
jgi:hypothetical protein